ncbi:MAG: DNA repair protein [Burkholderiaceae bacterium]|nr:DNA repair protein [Burkholderiaceae bacterium]
MNTTTTTLRPRRRLARQGCEGPPPYKASGTAGNELRPPCVAEALAWLESRVNRGPVLSAADDVRAWLRLRYGTHDAEVFGALFLDAHHRLIECRELCAGTLTKTQVHPRDVVRQALALNASALLLFHHHPGGSVNRAQSDECVTRSLRPALALVDVRLLDHLVVSASDSMSFAERGLL